MQGQSINQICPWGRQINEGGSQTLKTEPENTKTWSPQGLCSSTQLSIPTKVKWSCWEYKQKWGHVHGARLYSCRKQKTMLTESCEGEEDLKGQHQRGREAERPGGRHKNNKSLVHDSEDRQERMGFIRQSKRPTQSKQETTSKGRASGWEPSDWQAEWGQGQKERNVEWLVGKVLEPSHTLLPNFQN